MPEDAIEELAITTTGATELRYTGMFIDNWKTAAGANVCYRVTMLAQDGSKIEAYFNMK